MENWFKNEWLYDKNPKRGESLTEMYKNEGYKSLQELKAYGFVDNIIRDYGIDMGISPESMVDLAIDIHKSYTKNEKLELYRMLDLTEVLNKALQMTEDEKLKFYKEFKQKLIDGKTKEELESTLKNQEIYIELLQQKEEDLRKRLKNKSKKGSSKK